MWGHGGSCESSQGFWAWQTAVGGLLKLGSSFSRIGAQSLRVGGRSLYDMTLIGLGRGILTKLNQLGPVAAECNTQERDLTAWAWPLFYLQNFIEHPVNA